MDNPILELLICTLNEGIRRVPEILLPPRPNVRYLVSWQQTGTVRVDLPEQLAANRPDVQVLQLDGRGLAVNRNNALRNATGDILIFADDDTKYTENYFERILYNFKKYPKADIICFRAVDHSGKALKRYAAAPFTYAERPRGTYFSSVEIAFRRSPSIPFFDERFGLGSKYLACGEEEVFLHTAFQNGMKIIYVPETVVETDANTTGKRFRTFAAVRRAKGAVLCYLHGPAGATLRSMKYVMMMQDVGMEQRLHFYKDMVAGIRYIQTGHI